MATESSNTQDQLTEDKPITFDERQQEKVNTIVQERVRKAERTANERFESEKTALQTRIDELEAKVNNSLNSNLGTTKKKPDTEADIEALNGKLAELTSLLDGQKRETERYKTEATEKAKLVARTEELISDTRKENAMRAAAQAAKFLDIDDIVELQKKNVFFDNDSGKWAVRGDQGQVRLNASMEYMSLEEYFNDIASRKRHWVAGNVPGGIGSTPSNGVGVDGVGTVTVDQVFGPKSNARIAMALKKSNPDRYRMLKAQAIKAGFIAA